MASPKEITMAAGRESTNNDLSSERAHSSFPLLILWPPKRWKLSTLCKSYGILITKREALTSIYHSWAKLALNSVIVRYRIFLFSASLDSWICLLGSVTFFLKIISIDLCQTFDKDSSSFPRTFPTSHHSPFVGTPRWTVYSCRTDLNKGTELDGWLHALKPDAVNRPRRETEKWSFVQVLSGPEHKQDLCRLLKKS